MTEIKKKPVSSAQLKRMESFRRVARHTGTVVNTIMLNDDIYQCTLFADNKTVIRGTLRRYKGKILKTGNKEIMLSIGKPNFREREKINRWKRERGKDCIRDHLELKRVK